MCAVRLRVTRRLGLVTAGALIIAACSGVSPDQLPPIPEPDIDGSLAAVAQQVGAARTAVSRRPTSARANGELGMLYRTYVDFEAAEVAFRRARLLAPGEPKWAYYHGETLEQLGAVTQAQAAMRDVLAADPGNGPARLRLARMLADAGQAEEAASLLEPLLAGEPASAGALLVEASVREQRGELQPAIAALRRALDVGGEFGQAHYALSRLYRRLGDADAERRQLALFEVYRAVSTPVDDPWLTEVFQLNLSDRPYVHAAERANRRGDTKRALELLEQANERNPNSLVTRAGLVEGYATTGDFERAEAHYEKGAKIDANNVELLCALGRLRLAQGRVDEALEAFSNATGRAPAHARAQAWRGYALERIGDIAAAGEAYRAAADANPSQREVRDFYARWLTTYAQPEIASSELQRLARTPALDAASMWATLAKVQLAQGRVQPARTSIAAGLEAAQLYADPKARRQLQRLSAQLDRTPVRERP